MKAIVFTKYGLPKEVLQIKDVDKPSPKDNEVLVKIYASSICWADNALVKGKPFISRLRARSMHALPVNNSVMKRLSKLPYLSIIHNKSLIYGKNAFLIG